MFNSVYIRLDCKKAKKVPFSPQVYYYVDMDKPKLWLLISLIFISLATTILWLSKASFFTHEAYDPSMSSSQATEPEGTDENPDSDASETTGNLQNATIERAEPEPLIIDVPTLTGPLEFPVEGATGWAAIAMPLYSEANIESEIIAEFNAGQVFVVLEEQGDWWKVESHRGETGWVEHVACFINLPDVIPSIAYNITNAKSALTRSSGYEIPGVTGQKLYEAGPVHNPRLQKDEFIVPALYSTSKLLCIAQHLALASGDTIILHEAYRDQASLQRSVRLLRELMDSNEKVRSAIEDGVWTLTWFIATSISNHQRGAAFDVSLGKILSYETVEIGETSYIEVLVYAEYNMPTSVHELSPLAITLVEPVSSRSRDAWRDAQLANTMTPGAIQLQKYFDEAGFTPLASEWWHFNDLEGAAIAQELEIVGSFLLGNILSVPP